VDRQEFSQIAAELVVRPHQQRLDGGSAALHHLGNLGVRQLLVAMEDNGHLLPLRQGEDGLANAAAQLVQLGGLAGVSPVPGGRLCRERAGIAAAAAEGVATKIHDDSV
jgi:hypothetical protein